jgi:hypothetical protein
MGIRFSIPEFLLIVVIAPGLSACTKKDRECNCTVNVVGSPVVQNTTKSKAGKKCGDDGKRIGSQQSHYVYTCNVHS